MHFGVPLLSTACVGMGPMHPSNLEGVDAAHHVLESNLDVLFMFPDISLGLRFPGFIHQGSAAR